MAHQIETEPIVVAFSASAVLAEVDDDGIVVNVSRNVASVVLVDGVHTVRIEREGAPDLVCQIWGSAEPASEAAA